MSSKAQNILDIPDGKPGPEKYREHWSTAPRKGLFCQPGKSHVKGKGQY